MTKISAYIEHEGTAYRADLNSPLDISLELSSEKNAQAWYVDLPKIEPVMTEQFTGSVALGGAVNFRSIFFNPHGHGTHTECVGHITKEVHSVNTAITKFFSVAQLITLEPETLGADDRWMKKYDLVISASQLKSAWRADTDSLIIRTIPNTEAKTHKNYSASNPPYIHPEAMQFIADSDIKHLLLDLPSVDRENDEGLLTAHHMFWQVSAKINHERTITELIYAESSIPDGLYLLELQVAPFKNDASPSRPVLYKLK